jgi:MarR family transcriptional regulator, organic hydroperoxide resistance regulator
MNKNQTPLDDIAGFSTWLSVARACHLCERALSAALEPHGLEVSHYDVLANVVRDEGLTQQVLARRLLVAKSNVSALLTALERKGLIVRDRDPDDARLRRIVLTPAGRRITGKAMREHGRIVTLMMGALTPSETETIHAVMGKISAKFEVQAKPTKKAIAHV